MALVPGNGVDLDGDGIIEALEGLVSDAGEDLDGDGVIEAVEGIVDGIKTGVFVIDPPEVVDATLEADPTAEGEGAEPLISILEGGQFIRVDIPGRDNKDDIYLQVYELPDGTSVYFQFNSADQAATVFGEPFAVNVVLTEAEFDTAVSEQTFILGGEGGEVMEIEGNFQDFYRTAQVQALASVGITDPGVVGQLLADSQVQEILTLGQIAENGLTDEQVTARLRNTDIWTEVLYPGIEFFFNRGDAEPELSYVNYVRSVEDGLRELGVLSDADGSYRQSVGGMLDLGIDDGEFAKFLPTALKVQQNPGLKDNMDQWALQELGRVLDFSEYLDVLGGTSDPELDAVIEGATLAFQAEAAGVDVSVSDIKRIAEGTDLSDAQALAAFTQTERALLAIGVQELGQFGITRGDFLDIAAGIAPRSGKSAAEVGNLGNKLATERGLSDDPRARFFLGFSDRGQAQRTGLAPLTGEGG